MCGFIFSEVAGVENLTILRKRNSEDAFWFFCGFMLIYLEMLLYRKSLREKLTAYISYVYKGIRLEC